VEILEVDADIFLTFYYFSKTGFSNIFYESQILNNINTIISMDCKIYHFEL